MGKSKLTDLKIEEGKKEPELKSGRY